MVEFEVASVANSQAAGRSSLLLPLSHKSRDAGTSYLMLRIWLLPEGFLPSLWTSHDRNPDKIASATVVFSVSEAELVLFNSLMSNILQATSWLDHGLDAIAKMLG